jgi:hypothetical protein
MIKEKADKMLVEPGNTFGDYDLAALYSTAIIKFVDTLGYYQLNESNGLPCIVRIRQKTDRGIKWTAKALGVPGWIIDCRHDACHSVTPPLSMLRQAAHIAKAWLDKNFWAHKLAELNNIDTNFHELISNYLSAPDDQRPNLRKTLKQAIKSNQPFAMYAIVSAILAAHNSDLRSASRSRQEGVASRVSIQFKNKITPLVSLINKLGHQHVLLNALISEFSGDANCASNDLVRRQHAFDILCEFINGINEYPVSTKFGKAVQIPFEVRSSGTFVQNWTKLFYRLMTQSTLPLTAGLITAFSTVTPNAISLDLVEKCTQLAVIYHQADQLTDESNRKTKSSVNESQVSVKTVTDLVRTIGT